MVHEAPPLDRPPSLSSTVVAYLRDAIIRGDFAPGQQLAEAPLAQALGTSRGTMREAMRVLSNMGLVSISTHRIPVVTPLTRQTAEETYTLRALLESYAARLATERGRLDEQALGRLAARAEAIASAGSSGGVPAMVQADMEFHWELSALSGHELLLRHLAGIQNHSRRVLVYSHLYRPDFAEVLERHLNLMAVLRGGDPVAVEEAIADHISSVGLTIVDRMSSGSVADATAGLLGKGPAS